MSLQRPRKRKDTPPTSYVMNLHQNHSTEEISRLTSSEPVPIFQQSQSHASSAAIAIPHSGQHYSAIPSSYQSSLGNNYSFDFVVAYLQALNEMMQIYIYFRVFLKSWDKLLRIGQSHGSEYFFF